MSNTLTASKDSDILDMFGIDKNILESYEIHHLNDGVHIFVKLKAKTHECPVCGNPTSHIKGYTEKKITHSVLVNNPCFIEYKARRYVCKQCGKTFYEFNPFTFNGMKISAVTVYNILLDLKDPHETFTTAAQRYHVSVPTVIKIFDNHVHISRRKLPRYLAFDEIYAYRSDGKGHYLCVLLDFETKKIVDILPSRKKDDLIRYFSSIPKKEREGVLMTSFDMWETYRTVSKLMFPNGKSALDHYHLCQEVTRRVDKVRIRVMNHNYHIKNVLEKKKKEGIKLTPDENERLEKAVMNYYVLKKFNWMLYKNDVDFDPNEEKKFNRVLNRYHNYYSIMDYLLNIDKDLETAYNLKDEIKILYDDYSYENSKQAIDTIIYDFRNCGIKELVGFADTLVRWKPNIKNSLIVLGEKYDKKKKKKVPIRMNNGRIEAMNKSIKLIKHGSNGYSNFTRFRNRILYSLNDDTTFSMYPKEMKEEIYYYG